MAISKNTFNNLQQQRSTTNAQKKKSIFELVYANSNEKKSSRPATFSFRRVMQFKEVQLLIVLATLEQLASYMNIDEDHPELNHKLRNWPLVYYIYGSAIGVFFLAFYSHCFIS